jgi:6-phosphogluconate dehydrogenase
MLPAGEATDATIRSLTEILSRGDLIVDGANSDFRNTLRNAALLQDTGIRFADVGVSGGIWGATEGYGLLVGGDPLDMDSIRPLCATLSRPGGFAHVGPVGSGHFAKMVHNGVEYAVMQAYAEGYELLAASDLSVDISAAVSVFATACSIRAWLLDHLARALAQNPKLEGVKGWVGDSGMGRWTIEEAVRLSVPIPAITAGLYARFTSRQEDSPAMRSIAALRQEVGGHKAKR